MRAASASPAGEEKLRLHVVASAQGAARARDVRTRHSIRDEEEEGHLLMLLEGETHVTPLHTCGL